MSRSRREVPWLTQRDGVYYVYWYDKQAGRTKRRSTGTSDPLEAQKWYAKFLTGGEAAFSPRGTSGITVSHALDDYWREHVGQHVVAKKRIEDCIHHLKMWFGDKPLRDIDIPACRGYMDARRIGVVGADRYGHGITEACDSTIRRELTVLQAAANHAARWRRIGPSADPPTPMPSIEKPHEPLREALTENDWLTREELARAIHSAPQRLKDFIVIAYDTASRRGAVEALTRFQVDLKAGLVNLRSPNEDVNQRRSKKRRPVVPIGPDARPVYERLMMESKNEWLFGSYQEMYWPFRRHMERIGLGHKRNPHILRHSRATHLLQSGISLWEVSQLLGDTMATVERVYGHRSVGHLAEVLKKQGGVVK